MQDHSATCAACRQLDFMRAAVMGNSHIDGRMFSLNCGTQGKGLFLFTMDDEDRTGRRIDRTHVRE